MIYSLVGPLGSSGLFIYMANWCSIEAEIVCFMVSFHTKTAFCMTLICPKAVSLITTKKLTMSSSTNCFPQTHKQKLYNLNIVHYFSLLKSIPVASMNDNFSNKFITASRRKWKFHYR